MCHVTYLVYRIYIKIDALGSGVQQSLSARVVSNQRMRLLCSVLYALSLVSYTLGQVEQKVPPLSECQKCCQPGGDCSKASHGVAGVCCGHDSNGMGRCCPASSGCMSVTVCARTSGYADRRSESSSLVTFICLVLLGASLASCLRARRHPAPPPAEIAMTPVSYPMAQPGVPVQGVPASSVPVAHAVAAGYPAQRVMAQHYPVATGYPHRPGCECTDLPPPWSPARTFVAVATHCRLAPPPRR